MRPLPSPNRSRAFTLVEMLLAITIAVGMLVVALLFYRQTADLRNQILLESERIATLRLLSDRIAGDLHLAVASPTPGQEFRGDTGAMSFVRVAGPVSTTTPGASLADRVRVTFSAVLANDGTNLAVLGIDRVEETLGTPRSSGRLPMTSLSFSAASTNSLASVTNAAPEPLTDLVRHLHLRYWDGIAWVDGWTNSTPPPGVEVVLAVDPQPTDGTETELPGEQFRRVVYIPAGLHLRPAPDRIPSSSLPP